MERVTDAVAAGSFDSFSARSHVTSPDGAAIRAYNGQTGFSSGPGALSCRNDTPNHDQGASDATLHLSFVFR